MDNIKTENFDELDKAKFGKFHLKIILVSGAGFFTDAYDLFCINLVMPMIGYVYYYYQPKHAIPSLYDSLVKSSSAWGNLIGQLLFGYMADKVGRKKMYGVELMIIIMATLGSALAANTAAGIQVLAMLGFWRFILGIGIGGDYPISSVITSEFSSSHHRGLMIAAVFAMQGCGMLMGSFVALIFLNILKNPIEDATVNLDFLWRICLGMGVLPGLAALYFRLKISESPRYLALEPSEKESTKEKELEIIPTSNQIEIVNMNSQQKLFENGQKTLDKKNTISLIKFLRKWHNLKILLGCAISWFAIDVAFYGSNLNQSFVIQTVGFAGSGTTYETFQKLVVGNLIVTLFGSFPGYWFTVCFVEKMGRKTIQIMGFVISGICWLILASAFQPLQEYPTAFIIIYIIAQFFINFGPNSTTFIVPGELFPTRFRSTCHGIAAATGKAGAIVAAQGFSVLKDTWGIPNLLYIFFGFMCVGLLATLWIPETKGKTLEELEDLFIYEDSEDVKVEKKKEIGNVMITDENENHNAIGIN